MPFRLKVINYLVRLNSLVSKIVVESEKMSGRVTRLKGRSIKKKALEYSRQAGREGYCVMFISLKVTKISMFFFKLSMKLHGEKI